MNWYWFSYSLDNVNQGVCIVKADSVESAKVQTVDLNLQPKYDDIMVQYTSVKNVPESKLPLSPYKLYSKEEMSKLGYTSVRFQK